MRCVDLFEDGRGVADLKSCALAEARHAARNVVILRRMFLARPPRNARHAAACRRRGALRHDELVEYERRRSRDERRLKRYFSE